MTAPVHTPRPTRLSLVVLLFVGMLLVPRFAAANDAAANPGSKTWTQAWKASAASARLATDRKRPRVQWRGPRVQRVAAGSVLDQGNCRLKIQDNLRLRAVRLSVTGSQGNRGLSFRRVKPRRAQAQKTPRRAVFQCRLDTSQLPDKEIQVRATAVDQAGNRRTVTRHIVVEPQESAPVSLAPRWFSPDSFWNRPLADTAPLSASSSTYVGELNRLVGQFGPWINTDRYSVPVYTVGPDQPTTSVRIVREDGESADPALAEAFSAVPIPAGARPSAGIDGHLVIWQPSSDRMWEFYVMRNEGGQWVAEHGGAMKNVSTNPGIFDRNAWEGAKDWWGATATSLPLLGGLMTIEELQAGSINHTLALALPEGSTAHVWPAKRSDGRSRSGTAIPEGTIFRLPADLDLATLDLPAPTLAIARAAQRHGMVVRDLSGCVCLYAEDPSQSAPNPYSTIFGGKDPGRLLAEFPWQQLQVVAPTG